MARPDPALASTPAPPYYAVVFTSRRSEADPEGYAAMAEHLDALARRQPGFLGIESVRGADRLGITVSYWESAQAVAAWKRVAVHAEAQRSGRAHWYEDYRVRVARVERDYSFDSSERAGL